MRSIVACLGVLLLTGSARITEQLVDKHKAPSTEDESVSRPLTSGSYPTQIGDGRWGKDSNSSLNVIAFDPFRAIRRERQLFQRKFTRLEGQGAAVGDGLRDIDVHLAAGAGLADSCHMPDLVINRDRRVADVEAVFDPVREHFNCLFATARPLLANPDAIRQPGIRKSPAFQRFVVEDVYSDFRRHDLGPSFHERNYDGTLRTHFLTPAFWGSTAAYCHEGRSINLTEVILRHGGEAQPASEAFAALPAAARDNVLAFLSSLVSFRPTTPPRISIPAIRQRRDFHHSGTEVSS